jgi:hypothetical protein
MRILSIAAIFVGTFLFAGVPAQAGSWGNGVYAGGNHVAGHKRSYGKSNYRRRYSRPRIEYGFRKKTVEGRDTYVVRPRVTRRKDPNDRYRTNTSRKLIQDTPPKLYSD